MSFADQVRARLPEGMQLPDAFAKTFDWAEAQGFAMSHDRPRDDPFERQSLSIYPADVRDTPGASHVVFSFMAGAPLHAPPPEVTARIVQLAELSGDGGTLSLWLDEANHQRFVVFNHGQPHVLCDDPLVALQFLAMGYPEPAILADPTLTPEAQAAQDFCDAPLLPHGFRAFLSDAFGVTVPARAADLGISVPAEGAPDAVRDWLDRVMPEPDASEIPGMTPENPYVITAELREILGAEGVAILRETYDYVSEEE